MSEYDLIVLGGGPGGYVAAIRGNQLGLRVALVEKDKMGGVCLNRGCIPTKALLKSAHSASEIKSLSSLGVNVESVSLDPGVAVRRANEISERVSKGVDFLMKKNKVEIIKGTGRLTNANSVEVEFEDGKKQDFKGKNIIIATGAHYKTYPGLEHDGKRLIGASEALKMEELPKSMAIIGAGAIGVEFAYFWNSFGVDVHIFEIMNHILPLEDEDSSKELARAFKKKKIKMTLGASKVVANNNGDSVTLTVTKKDKEEKLSFEKCLISVGMTGNIDDIGLNSVDIKTANGFIEVDDYGQTSVPGVYAIGDVSGPPLLAHVASHQGVIAVEKIKGMDTKPLNRGNIPGCTYCQPQVASVGETEKQLKERGVEYSTGKMLFRANGKAVASNEIDGFVKTYVGSDGKLLGAHIVGSQATELLHEYTLLRSMDGVVDDIIHTIHPHPTMGEWLPESLMATKGEALHS